VRYAIRNGHPKGNGRRRELALSDNCASVGATTSGHGRLPDDTERVSLSFYETDGVDASTSTYHTITLSTDDDPNMIDALIGKLTDLRAHQRRTR
jgi:hypothetical protein